MQDRKYSHFELVENIDIKDLPQTSGIYIFRLKKNVKMNGFENDQHKYNKRIVYVGKAEGIKKNKNTIRKRFKSHTKDDSSGSTLRRSIGAIFKEEWNLKAFPRNGNVEYASLYNFIDNESIVNEKKITTWMKKHLEYRFIVSPEPIEKEKEYTKKFKPTLNDKEYNPMQEKLFGKRLGGGKRGPSLRTTCRKEAEKFCKF